MRTAARMHHFPPTPLVATALRMSRCMAAQLASAGTAPPKGYPLPPGGSTAFKAAELGLKVATGLEIVCARADKAQPLQQQDAQQPPPAPGAGAAGPHAPAPARVRSPGRLAVDLAHHPGWRAFRASLEGAGYFRGELEGSQEHSRLLQAAVDDFMRSDLYAASQQASALPPPRPSPTFSPLPRPPFRFPPFWEPAWPAWPPPATP